ncbi:MAG: ANTAR domain-containing protein [Microlunatus sp.]|nr:ANTAR domain-containing protein [Microlunatus sp.]MDN5771146.1 ANTAR domain-containing protein [Microlunatus sp.]MDN5804794.1 ANTAR domain-containing protein [Microlunatus sp.]
MARISPDGYSSTYANHALSGDAARLAELERKVANLQAALESQRVIGAVVGLVAQRYGCTTDEAWAFLVRLSQDTQVKVRDIARVLHDSFNGESREDDVELLVTVTARLPGRRWSPECLRPL